MSKQRKIELKRAITEIQNPFPTEKLVSSYADFLKIRDYLRYYQFNADLLTNLLNLSIRLWNTEKRINRLSLLQTIKQYTRLAQQISNNEQDKEESPRSYSFSLEIRKLFFALFEKVFENQNRISERQIDEALKICNNVLINIELTAVEEKWLCERAHLSEIILNRVLRYPVKSAVISQWAKENFLNDIYRNRRAELISWLIDLDPAFEINKQILIDDFEYMNACDLKSIQDFNRELKINEAIERELGNILPKKQRFQGSFGGNYFEESVNQSPSELKLTNRFYGIIIRSSEDYPIKIPDFDKMRINFHEKLPLYHKITMIWGIAYSRTNNETKCTLLKKYYSSETYYSLYRVSKRTKNIALLQWLLEQQ